jgi:hypothetical protein
MLKNSSIDKLTTLLSLKSTGLEQDWDVELADENRIGEFISVYEESSLSSDDKLALMSLTLASVDRYIELNSKLPHEWDRIVNILLQERDLHEETVAYWRRDDDDDPEAWFCLTPYIRTLSQNEDFQ